jgi:hypothetical protein
MHVVPESQEVCLVEAQDFIPAKAWTELFSTEALVA